MQTRLILRPMEDWTSSNRLLLCVFFEVSILMPCTDSYSMDNETMKHGESQTRRSVYAQERDLSDNEQYSDDGGDGSDEERDERNFYEAMEATEVAMEAIDDKYEVVLHTIMSTIDSVQTNIGMLGKYLRINESDAADLIGRYGVETLTLCKIFTRNLSKTRDAISEMTADTTPDDSGKKKMVKHTQLDDEDDALSSLVEYMHLNSTDSGFPELIIDRTDVRIGYAAMFFFLYSIRNRGFKSMEMIERLHDFRINQILPGILDTTVNDSIKKWPSPAIRHRSYGMHEAAYVPLIHFMLSSEFRTPHSDWIVLFHVADDIHVYEPFPDAFIQSLKKTYAEIDPRITKILLVLNVQMGDRYGGVGHVLTFLVSREPSHGGIFITILDILWIRTEHSEYNRHYIERMQQIADECIGEKSIGMVLSNACFSWIESKRSKLKRNGIDSSDLFKGLNFIKHDTLGLKWLSFILSREFKLRKLQSNAMVCPFDAALFVVSCIQGRSLETEYELNSVAAKVENVIDKLNVELSISILSGYCLLSPASVQRVFYSMGWSQSIFYAVDCMQNVPSNTYAWAVSSQKGKPSIFALIHDTEYDADFHWERRHYSYTGPADSKTLLEKLKRSALLIVSDKLGDSVAGVKRGGMEVEDTDPNTRTRLRSALKVVHRVLKYLTFE